ncbi:MAG TPA: TIGR03435 family protein [Bryobacteraceae bacterium]|jgi:uncharacterized protein (TIGR03435 family)
MNGRVFAWAVLLAVAGWAQAQEKPRFEVATVKLVDVSKLGDLVTMNLGQVRHEELTFGNAALVNCIRFAYNLASDEQIVGPAWIKSFPYFYDIDAKGPVGSTREQLQAMMQTLLEDRFKLVVHREQKEMSHYALVLAKGGSKMTAVKELPPDYRGTNFGGRIDNIMPMTLLAYLLSRFETERPILDMTGLPGLYTVKLEWALAKGPAAAGDSAGPSLFTALEEQLGLRLEGRKGPVEVLVVDAAEKAPAEN